MVEYNNDIIFNFEGNLVLWESCLVDMKSRFDFNASLEPPNITIKPVDPKLLDLGCAPYVLYGVKYIGLVSLSLNICTQRVDHKL